MNDTTPSTSVPTPILNAAATAFGMEWTVLQNNYEQYERSALYIKLSAVVLCVISALWALSYVVVVGMVAVLWLQEAVLKVFQARLGARLLHIERQLQQQLPLREAQAFQLHSEWQASRPGTAGLMIKYAKSALRPTVALPYVPLLALVLAFW